MSKQSDAKQAQNYVEKAPCCGDCHNMKSELQLQAWMIEDNERQKALGYTPRYVLEKHGVEKNLRCGIGGFKIKKNGICRQHQPKEQQ